MVLMVLMSVVTYSNAQEEEEGRILKVERTGSAKHISSVKKEGEDDIDFLNKNFDIDAAGIDDIYQVNTVPEEEEEEEATEETPIADTDKYTPSEVSEKQAVSTNAVASAPQKRTTSTRSTSSYKKSSKRKRSWNYGRVKKMKRKPRLGTKRRGCPTY